MHFRYCQTNVRRLLPGSDYCRALFRCLNCAQRFDYRVSVVIESWDESPNIWLMVVKNAVVSWALNVRVCILLKIMCSKSIISSLYGDVEQMPLLLKKSGGWPLACSFDMFVCYSSSYTLASSVFAHAGVWCEHLSEISSCGKTFVKTILGKSTEISPQLITYLVWTGKARQNGRWKKNSINWHKQWQGSH